MMPPTICEACGLSSIDIRRVQVVENDWQWLCPHCRKTAERQPFAEADAALTDIESEARKLPHKLCDEALMLGHLVRAVQMQIDAIRRQS